MRDLVTYVSLHEPTRRGRFQGQARECFKSLHPLLGNISTIGNNMFGRGVCAFSARSSVVSVVDKQRATPRNLLGLC